MSDQSTEPKPNRCELCGQDFNSAEDLQAHKNQAHKG